MPPSPWVPKGSSKQTQSLWSPKAACMSLPMATSHRQVSGPTGAPGCLLGLQPRQGSVACGFQLTTVHSLLRSPQETTGSEQQALLTLWDFLNYSNRFKHFFPNFLFFLLSIEVAADFKLSEHLVCVQAAHRVGRLRVGPTSFHCPGLLLTGSGLLKQQDKKGR